MVTLISNKIAIAGSSSTHTRHTGMYAVSGILPLALCRLLQLATFYIIIFLTCSSSSSVDGTQSLTTYYGIRNKTVTCIAYDTDTENLYGLWDQPGWAQNMQLSSAHGFNFTFIYSSTDPEICAHPFNRGINDTLNLGHT